MTALAILEGAATALAQPRLVAADFARLSELASSMERSADPVRFGALNRELHELITARCGNAYLLELLQQTSDRLDRIRATMFAYLPDRLVESAREHSCLIELLQAGDAAEVERYARWHKLQTIRAYRARR
jgi:DNA-binding GntR family transcriptional regulator